MLRVKCAVRYHGALAPDSKLRARIVPRPAPGDSGRREPHGRCGARGGAGGPAAAPTGTGTSEATRTDDAQPERDTSTRVTPNSRTRFTWAELMKRVFARVMYCT